MNTETKTTPVVDEAVFLMMVGCIMRHLNSSIEKDPVRFKIDVSMKDGLIVRTETRRLFAPTISVVGSGVNEEHDRSTLTLRAELNDMYGNGMAREFDRAFPGLFDSPEHIREANKLCSGYEVDLTEALGGSADGMHVVHNSISLQIEGDTEYRRHFVITFELVVPFKVPKCEHGTTCKVAGETLKDLF